MLSPLRESFRAFGFDDSVPQPHKITFYILILFRYKF